MDAADLKKAAEYSARIDDARAALEKIADYCDGRYALLTGGVEVNVPTAQGRPPNEDQTIHPGRLDKEESDKLRACLEQIYNDRITAVSAAIAAL